MQFLSDNAAPVHPKLWDAMRAADAVDTPYDTDALSRELDARFTALFGRECAALWVATGTAANCLALATMVQPHGGVICHEEAHIEMDECGAPGFYLHLDPTGSFVGVGLWRPDGPSALLIREAIVDRPKAWMAVTTDPDFVSTFTQEGESLKRPPRGFDPDHPQIEDLKRRDFIASAKVSRKSVTAPDFLEQYAGTGRNAAGYMEFLTRSLGLPF